MVYKLVLDEEHFDAMHYLPKSFGKCNRAHGHRYHLKKIEITTSFVVDFSLIGKAIDEFDHCTIIPKCDEDFWLKVKNFMESFIHPPCTLKLKVIPYSATTCEELTEAVKEEILKIPGVESVSFILYETDTDGVQT